jgi:predicted CopG family antitoxin
MNDKEDSSFSQQIDNLSMNKSNNNSILSRIFDSNSEEDEEDNITNSHVNQRKFQKPFINRYQKPFINSSRKISKSSKSSPSTPTPTTKRKNPFGPDSIFTKKMSIDTTQDVTDQLLIIDPNKKACIHKYIERYGTDPVVRHYAELMIESGFIPILPCLEIITDWLKISCPIIIPKEKASMMVSKCMDYFQARYFKNNVDGAIKANKKLFNPKNGFNVIHWRLVPAVHLENMTQSKDDHVMKVQMEASQATTFTSQLILLKLYMLNMLIIC